MDNRFIFSLVLSLFLGTGPLNRLYSQDAAFSFSDKAILARLTRDIRVLASDSLEGREAGTHGDTLAAEYIAASFRETGLIPKGADSTYFQEVPFDYPLYDYETNIIKTDFGRYVYRRDFGVTRFSSNGKVKGKILDTGNGLDTSLSGSPDAGSTREYAGCVVLMEYPLPKNRVTDTVNQSRFALKNRLLLAFERGATAVLLWNSDSPDYPGLFDMFNREPMPGPVLFIRETVARGLKKHVNQQISIETNVQLIHNIYRNISGYIDNRASKVIVIGAHYDHEGLNRVGVPMCGADDNASGVALMLELARFMKNSGPKQYNYLFVAFGAEEMGMIGSGYFCNHPLVPIVDITMMCNFDMVGRLGAEGNRITFLGAGTSPQWKIISRQISKPSFRIHTYKGASNFSDQECFYKAGIPIFYLTTGMHPDYHTHRDRPERINYTGLADITKYGASFISLAANQESITFSPVSRWSTVISDTHYFLQQIGHLFEIPAEDWP